MASIKVAILVDPMGHGFGEFTAEDEVENHKKVFTEVLKPAEIRFQHVWSPGAIDPGTDLVIYDFGGMMPGTDLMDSNARAIVQWANDNPNSLLVVVSSFTFDIYIKREMEELGLTLFNVVHDNGAHDSIPSWFREKFQLDAPDLDKILDLYLSGEISKPVKEDKKPVPEPPKKKEPKKKKVKEPQGKEAPKKPIGFITVPVYCDWYPGVTSGTMRFKIADSMVDISDDNDKQIAHMGGAFAGFYEISFPNGKGDLWGYHIKPNDFWPAFAKLHSEVKDSLETKE
jgi:hypothetical protein